MFVMQNIPRIPMVSFIFFCMWDSIPKIRVLLYDVTIRCNVEEINFVFGGSKNARSCGRVANSCGRSFCALFFYFLL